LLRQLILNISVREQLRL